MRIRYLYLEIRMIIIVAALKKRGDLYVIYVYRKCSRNAIGSRGGLCCLLLYPHGIIPDRAHNPFKEECESVTRKIIFKSYASSARHWQTVAYSLFL